MTLKKKLLNKKFIFFVISLVFIGYILFSLYKQEVILQSQRAELNQLKSDVAKQKSLNKYYKSNSNKKSNDDAIEKLAREKLGMILGNEKIYIDDEK